MVRKWSAQLSRDCLAHWLDLLTAQGWMAREQVSAVCVCLSMGGCLMTRWARACSSKAWHRAHCDCYRQQHALCLQAHARLGWQLWLAVAQAQAKVPAVHILDRSLCMRQPILLVLRCRLC